MDAGKQERFLLEKGIYRPEWAAAHLQVDLVNGKLRAADGAARQHSRVRTKCGFVSNKPCLTPSRHRPGVRAQPAIDECPGVVVTAGVSIEPQ